MRLNTILGRVLAGLGVAASVATGLVVASTSANAACTDIDVVFARGSTEPAGLGIVGRPFVSSLTSALSGYTVSSYAVVYAANITQTSSGAGSTDMVRRINEVSAACPNTRFVIGGYSQGATVTDKAVGIRTTTGGTGSVIPAALAGRVSAVVVFGNPLGINGGATISSSSTVYGPKSRDYCNSADSVCGSQPKNGTGGHTSYPSNGATSAGATFAAGLVRAGTAPTTPPTTTPTTPPTTPPALTCVRDSTNDHVDDGRARSVFGRSYAVGSRDSLGYTSRFNIVSLQQTAPENWELVPSC